MSDPFSDPYPTPFLTISDPFSDKLEAHFPDVMQVAFMDNLYLVAPAERAAQAAAHVGTWLKDFLLTLKPEKSNVWSPSPLPPAAVAALVAAGIPAARIAPSHEGIVVLGAPMGTDAYMSAHCVATVDSQFAVLDSPAFAALSAQTRWLQLHFAVSKRVAHLARLVPPGCLFTAEARARAKLAAAFASLFHMDAPLRTDIEGRLFLPVRMGGLGVRPFTLEPAFLAGMLAGRQAVLTRLGGEGTPELDLSSSDASLRLAVLGVTAADFCHGRLHAARSALKAAESRSVALASAAQRAPPTAAQAAEVAAAAVGKGPTVLSEILDPSLGGVLSPTLQALLSAILHKYHLEVWRARAPPNFDAARIGCTGAGAASWLVSVPGSVRSSWYLPCLWEPSLFITAVQVYCLHTPSVLTAAGYKEAAYPCWLRLSTLRRGDQDDFDVDDGANGGENDSVEEVAAGVAHKPSSQLRSEPLPPPPPLHQGPPVPRPPPPSPPPLPARKPRPGSCGKKHTLSPPLGWLSLLHCCAGGFTKATHDSISAVLACLAPPGRMGGALPGLGGFATAERKVIQQWQSSRAPGRQDWATVDLEQPQGPVRGLPLGIDVTVRSTPSISAGCRKPDPAASVDAALAAAEKEKAAHYAADGCTGPGGPLGPSKGTYRTFAIGTFGRLAPGARTTLREWSYMAARATPGAGTLPQRAAAHCRSYHRVVSTTLWRWHAFRIHQAAGWLAEDLLRSGVVGAAAPAPVWPGAAAPSAGVLPRFSARHAPLGQSRRRRTSALRGPA